jgi:hypothetical protein
MTQNFEMHFRNGLDSCLLYATFETMLEQIRCRREVNVSGFSRHLASTHDLALSSVDQVKFNVITLNKLLTVNVFTLSKLLTVMCSL